MKRSDQFSDIREIAEHVCENTVTDEQLQQLEEKLKDNPEAKRFYFDYLRIHNAMKSAADRNMEIVYKRMTEEVIVRPQSKQTIDNNPALSFIPRRSVNIIFSCALALAIIIFFFVQRHYAPPSRFTAKLIDGQITIDGQAKVKDDAVSLGEYSIPEDTVLSLPNGDIVELLAGSKLTFIAHNEIQLKAGKIALKSLSGENIDIYGDNFKLSSNGGELTVNLTAQAPLITTGATTELHAKRWRPAHYWPFEGQTDRVINSASDAHGVPESGAVRVQGLVGSGAFYFDNSENARIMLGSGGGTALGTGSFSANDGISIAALIQPQYSGEKGEQDEIFRKGDADGDFRMLLGFQHDYWKDYLMPQKQVAESLSFGLHLLGHGYQELKLPLDGKEGRPSLEQMKNGDTYFVVANYNVSSGLKAIYINGERLAWYEYPKGTKVITGGPGEAVIGNNPIDKGTKWDVFAYSGVIDELAIYDFALPAFTIQHYFEQVQRGANYFGLKASIDVLPDSAAIQLPANSEVSLDPITGLPDRILSTNIK